MTSAVTSAVITKAKAQTAENELIHREQNRLVNDQPKVGTAARAVADQVATVPVAITVVATVLAGQDQVVQKDEKNWCLC